MTPDWRRAGRRMDAMRHRRGDPGSRQRWVPSRRQRRTQGRAMSPESTSSDDRRSPTRRATSTHGSLLVTTNADSGSTPSQAGSARRSSGRASVTAIHPSAAGSRRVAPPQLARPAGRNSNDPARSDSAPRPHAPYRSASPAPAASSPATTAATVRTRRDGTGTSGCVSDWQPDSAQTRAASTSISGNGGAGCHGTPPCCSGPSTLPTSSHRY